MASLLGWLGKTVKDTENNIGNFVNGTAQNVNHVAQGVQQAANTVNQNYVQPIEHTAQQAYHTVQAPITGLTGAGAAIGDKLFNGGKNYQSLIDATKTSMDREIKQSFVPQNVASGKASPLEFGKDFTKTGVELAPYAIGGAGGGLTKALGGRVANGITSRVADTTANKIGAKIAGSLTKNAANAAVSVPTFSALNAGQQLIDNGGKSFDINQANQAGLTAGAMTLAGGLAGDAAGAGVKVAANGIKAGVGGAKAAAPAVAKAINESKPSNHPAVLDLNNKLTEINQHRDRLVAQGLSEGSPAMKANAKAYAQTAQARSDMIKQISQGGSVKAGMFDPTGRLGRDSNIVNPQLKLSSSGNVYITHDAGAITGLPKTIQNDLHSVLTEGIISPDRHMKMDKFLNSKGVAITKNPDTGRYSLQSFKSETDSANRLASSSEPQSSGTQSLGKASKVPQQPAQSKAVSPEASSAPSVPPIHQAMQEALGMTPEDISKSQKTGSNLDAAAEKTSPSQTTSEKQPVQGTPKAGRPEESTAQTPESGSKAAPRQQSTQETSKLSSSDKYTPNSTTVNVDEVKPGDYQKVRSNVQRVQSNVNVRARESIHAINKLSKVEKANFWSVVEGTAKSTSKRMDTAIQRWHELSDHVHATSQALGGDTPHLANYARHNWDLSDPAEAARFTELMNQKFNDKSGRTLSPEDFKGLDNKPRAFDTIAQGKKLGFKLKNEGNPAKDIEEYAHSSNANLRTQSVTKGMTEAESHIPDSQKPISQHVGYKANINVTQRGAHELRSLYEEPKPTFTAGQKAVDIYDKANKGVKAVVLSLSQFHTGNIGLQAIPTLAIHGHPIRAIKATVDTAASTFSPKYSDHIINNAIKDGTIDKAAQIGTPILDGSDFNPGGKLNLRAVAGEKLVFERQLPAMHIQMAKAVIKDLEDRGIPLDSKAARKAGNEVHQIMGYINSTLRNMSQRNMRAAGRVFLAPNFTLSKWAVLTDAFTKGGEAGSYARSAVVGKYMAQAAIIAGIGALVGQKSDNIKDILLRTLIHPSIPTPFKDSKGNTIEFGLPSNYLSEAAGLVSTLNRGKDGRLGVSVDPSNIPQNLENYGQGRLAAIPGMALKIATNQNYAGKPLYDPNAPLPSRVAQAATTLAAGALPIALQSGVYTQPVKDALGSIPGVGKDIKNVLDAGSPGTNPILKGIASSLGATARTDKTVGKGLQTTQYFNALNAAGKGLNHQEQDALDMFTGGKKNPVTGQYEITPNANDQRAKATALLDNPKTLDNLITMNQSLAKQGQSVDPIWNQPKDRIQSYFQYQAMAPGSADRTDWVNKNPWYEGDPNNANDKGIAGQRTDFFNALPAGDPNKPKLNIQYPDATPQVQQAMDAYSTLTDSTSKGQFLDSHPELLQQWKAQSDYTNKMRQALGYAPLKNAPEASDKLQSFMDQYNGADKATRKSIRNSNPSDYQSMIGFYDSLDLYNINKQGAVNQLQGEPDQTSKQNKAISNLAKDIYQNPDGSYSIVPAGWMNGLSNGSGYGSSKSKGQAAVTKALGSMRTKAPTFKPFSASSRGVVAKATYKSPALKNYSVKLPNVPIKSKKA